MRWPSWDHYLNFLLTLLVVAVLYVIFFLPRPVVIVPQTAVTVTSTVTVTATPVVSGKAVKR